MSGWLILWLSMVLFGPAAWIIVVQIERIVNDFDYDGLAVFLMVILFFGISAVGLLGTLGWLIAWGIG